MKWKLVVFDGNGDAPTTYTTPESSIASYAHIVKQIVEDDDTFNDVWADLNRRGARYSEWFYKTFVLVSYEI